MIAQKLIEDALAISNSIKKIRNENYDQRKLNKMNFNFFSAIVSGKHSRDHYEPYHSNFIAFLLNPNANHDCGSAFLKLFLEIVKHKILDQTLILFEDDEESCKRINVEREKSANGRYIDIVIESERWLVFIENKIGSPEGNNQVADYCKWAMEQKENWVGVYLTKDGSFPDSVKNDGHKGKVVCLSYIVDIVHWLTNCISQIGGNKECIHITGAIRQYIDVLETILSIMKKDSREIIDYLKKNSEIAAELVENRCTLTDALTELTVNVRNKFAADLSNEIKNRIQGQIEVPEGLAINVIQNEYFSSGNKNESYGLSFEVMKNSIPFEYKSDGIRSGNAIFIEGHNAHYGELDKSNGVLIKAFNSTHHWKKILSDCADNVMKEVQKDVLPKLRLVNAKMPMNAK